MTEPYDYEVSEDLDINFNSLNDISVVKGDELENQRIGLSVIDTNLDSAGSSITRTDIRLLEKDIEDNLEPLVEQGLISEIQGMRSRVEDETVTVSVSLIDQDGFEITL